MPNPWHEQSGKFARRPFDYASAAMLVGLFTLGGVVWIMALIGTYCVIDICKTKLAKNPIAAEENFVRAHVPTYTLEPSGYWIKNGEGSIQKTMKGCFTGESIDEIARLIREGEGEQAIRKLEGR